MSRRFPIFAFTCVVLAIPQTTIKAQRTVRVAVGSKVRVRPAGDSVWRVGLLTSSTPDTLRLRSCDSCMVDVYSLSSLRAIEVKVGERRSGSAVGMGAVLGGMIGIGAGWFYGWRATRGCAPTDDLCGLAYLAIPFFAVGGVAIGAALGSTVRKDDWQPAVIR